jgi:hypothetical protein
MNKIVRVMKASELPPNLREGFPLDAEVEVAVTDLTRGTRRVAAAQEVRRALESYRRATGARPLTDAEVSERVRDARGEP